MFKVEERRKVVKDTTPDEGIWHRLPFAKPIGKFKINWISNLSHQLVENIPNPTAFRILIKREMAWVRTWLSLYAIKKPNDEGRKR